MDRARCTLCDRPWCQLVHEHVAVPCQHPPNLGGVHAWENARGPANILEGNAPAPVTPHMHARGYRVESSVLRSQALLIAGMLPHLKWRVHGIGLLQAYLIESDPEIRVHVWDEALLAKPGICDSGAIHTHRFRLDSTVLLGTIVHTEYQLVPGDEWCVWTVPNARKYQALGTGDLVPSTARRSPITPPPGFKVVSGGNVHRDKIVAIGGPNDPDARRATNSIHSDLACFYNTRVEGAPICDACEAYIDAKVARGGEVGAWAAWALGRIRGLADGGTLANGGARYNAHTRVIRVREGTRYTFPRGPFHRATGEGLCVTLVTKYDQQHNEQAKILAPAQVPPEHAFKWQIEPHTVDHVVAKAVRALTEKYTTE